MKIVKKVSFSLIEVGIALFLAAAMIGLLFSIFTYSIKMKNQIENTAQVILKRKYLQERLTQMFSSSPENVTCNENVLQFSFDQGPDLEPKFSGNVSAKLYLEDDRFILALQSIQDPKLVRKEVLMENLEAIQWEFLPSSEKPPTAIRLTLHSDSPTSFAFFLAPPIFEAAQ